MYAIQFNKALICGTRLVYLTSIIEIIRSLRIMRREKGRLSPAKD